MNVNRGGVQPGVVHIYRDKRVYIAAECFSIVQLRSIKEQRGNLLGVPDKVFFPPCMK